MNKNAFGPVLKQESISFEEILKAENEGRLLILPYSAGQTIYKADYPGNSNRMIPVPVFLNSVLQVINVMFDTSHNYFETLEECQKYLEDFYGGNK